MEPNDRTLLRQFWPALERLPGLAAVRAQWRRRLGPDFPRARQFLVPGLVLASAYPRLDGASLGAPYKVVRVDASRFVGVCAEDQARVELTRADIVIYHLDCARLMRDIAAAFGLDRDGSAAGSVPFTFRVGVYRPIAGYSFPAYLTIQSDTLAFRQAVESVAALQDAPFLLLAPTNAFHHLRLASELVLTSKRACFIPLMEALALRPDGRWELTAYGKEAREAFRTSVVPAERGPDPMVFFPTPANAGWKDLHLHFVDGHTVSVRVGGVTYTLHFAQMGMVDHRNAQPTKQWELLRSFARGDGVMTWGNRAADRRNQKRRENLAKVLKRFFRIDGEPIVLTTDGKGWRTVFALESDT